MNYLLTFIFSLLGLFVIYKPFRWYIYSYFFNWLYYHPKVSAFLGIRYEDDTTWQTNRKDTRIYFTGIFVYILVRFTGLDFILADDLRKAFEALQLRNSKDISMEHYFNEISEKEITLREFESFLSRSILLETNRVFKVLTPEVEEEFLNYIMIVRGIVDSLTGSVFYGLYLMITRIWITRKISKILNSVEAKQRLLLHIPQLALINNFSKMLVRNEPDVNGKIRIEHLESCDFLEPLSKFFVAVNNDQLVFVHRHMDRNNTATNRAFGPYGYQCPGKIYSMRFIDSVLSFLQSFDIYVTGTPTYRFGRFKMITNKDQIKVKFIPKQFINEELDKIKK